MEGLGIDPIQLGAQIINFTIVIFVLKRLLYSPILTMLDKRRAEIKEGLEMKAKIEKIEERMISREKKLRKELREEERRVMKQAISEAKNRQKELLEEAKKEIEDERDKMLIELERNRKAAYEQSRQNALELAILISEKVLGKKLDSASQTKLLDDALKNLKG